ncbi:trypsin-like peptidase domain-containing protein [Actinomycetospora endophytica]|uniref:Trypsin-like peptidase domain-containing protein n=1 Tax=Actinomycetospora endophytica TaxID=2291215 RepID=A0ABS8P6J1_9PSEU|nr:trypsin-like peptidase domain-containing protein [Actinomycetospora endophytica]MCD2193872.1 trypsin-like peptidase domain-containing protein [Actinomycetospora endophytica]
MTDQDPFARAGQPGEPAHSAGPAPRDGSASAGVRYESPQGSPSPWSSPGTSDPSGGTATMPRTDQPTEQTTSPWGQHPGGWGQSPSSGPPQGPPPTGQWPTGGSGGGGGGRPRRSPLVLVSAALAALLVAGGVGGVVGYEAASAGGGGGGSSVLSGSSDSSSASSTAPAGSVESVAQKVLPSVVQLRGASGEGSGIVISADGLILTNAHVLEAGEQQTQQQGGLGGLGGLLGGEQQQQQPQQSPQSAQLQAVFQNGQTAQVQVVGTDATADLAVVRAQGVSNLSPVSIGDSSQLQVGQGVVAVGSPLGLSGTVTSGIVSALQRPVVAGGQGSGQATVSDAIQTDAAINPGNSGGALVDMNGRVVGITSSIASLGSGSGGGGGGSGSQQSGSIGLGFAIPINQAKSIGDQLAKQGFANQAVLGVGVAQDQSGATSENGATIGTVTPGGAAAAAGIKQGDVVTRVNSRLIDDGDSLIAAIRTQDPGAQVTLTVQSPGGQPRQVPVTLGTERAPSS